MSYKQCTRCVMDTDSGKTITFDSNGVCGYCTSAISAIKNGIHTEDSSRLDAMLSKIKAYGKNKKYDCLMGISGGMDSSYLLYLGDKWGLRILAIHVDDGFDAEVTKKNIARLSSACKNVELITITPDAERFCDLTKSVVLAGAPNLCAPQDNVMSAILYKYAMEQNIKYFLSGNNLATESLLESDNTYSFYDTVNLKSIHKKFGQKPLDKLPLMSLKEKDIFCRIYQKETLTPLNYVNYNVETALRELGDFCGFENYGLKHHENLLTKFNQIYYLYNKFGSDKRKSHLSSRIASGQITRDEALNTLKTPPYGDEMKDEVAYVISKLGFTAEEFDRIMKEPPRLHEEYETSPYIRLRGNERYIKDLKGRYENGSPFVAFAEEAKHRTAQNVFSKFRSTFEYVNKALLLELMSVCHENGVGLYDLADSIQELNLKDILNRSLIDGIISGVDLPMAGAARFDVENAYKKYAQKIFQTLNSVNRSVQGGRVLLICKAGENAEANPRLKLINELNEMAAIVLVYDGTTDGLGDNDDLYYKIGELTGGVLAYIDLVVILDESVETDYEYLCGNSRLVLDTRNILSSVKSKHNIILI